MNFKRSYVTTLSGNAHIFKLSPTHTITLRFTWIWWGGNKLGRSRAFRHTEYFYDRKELRPPRWSAVSASTWRSSSFHNRLMSTYATNVILPFTPASCSAYRKLYVRFVVLLNAVRPSGQYMYHKFNIQQLYVLSTRCIYLVCVDPRTNSDYVPIQH